VSDPHRVPPFLVPHPAAGVAHAPAADPGCPDDVAIFIQNVTHHAVDQARAR